MIPLPRLVFVFGCLFVFLAFNGSSCADDKAAMRLLRDECLACHKPGKAKGGLLLHTHEKMMAGGDNGVAVVPGQADNSLLYQVLFEDGDPHMPPKKQLSEPQLAAVKQWINTGAKWDESVFDEPPIPKKVHLKPLPPNYQPVLAMALSPNDQQLAVTQGRIIRVFDVSKNPAVEIARLEGHQAPVQSLVWTVDGKNLHSGGYQELISWNMENHRQQASHTAPWLGNLTALAIDREGKSLYVADATIGGAGFIHHYDLHQKKLQSTWKGHDDTIYALKISADDVHLLSGSADKLVKMWDRKTTRIKSLFEGHTNHVLGVDFNHDGTQIASTGADREVKIWDVKTKEQIVSLGNRKNAYASLDWSADGKKLAVVQQKNAGTVYSDFKVHDGAQSSSGTQQQILNSVSETLTCVCISSDGKMVYAGSFEGNLHRWDASNGKVLPLTVKP